MEVLVAGLKLSGVVQSKWLESFSPDYFSFSSSETSVDQLCYCTKSVNGHLVEDELSYFYHLRFSLIICLFISKYGNSLANICICYPTSANDYHSQIDDLSSQEIR